MGETIKELSAADASGSDEGLLCPKCGYDLRINTGEQCSECGEVIDREALRVSGFPWAHRGTVGWIKAYFMTVWLVSVGSRQLKNEAARPQDLRGAKIFARVNAVIVAAMFLGVLVIAAMESKGLSFMAVYPPDGFWGRNKSQWYFDLVVPWSNGATLWPVMPVML